MKKIPSFLPIPIIVSCLAVEVWCIYNVFRVNTEAIHALAPLGIVFSHINGVEGEHARNSPDLETLDLHYYQTMWLVIFSLGFWIFGSIPGLFALNKDSRTSFHFSIAAYLIQLTFNLAVHVFLFCMVADIKRIAGEKPAASLAKTWTFQFASWISIAGFLGLCIAALCVYCCVRECQNARKMRKMGYKKIIDECSLRHRLINGLYIFPILVDGKYIYVVPNASPRAPSRTGSRRYQIATSVA